MANENDSTILSALMKMPKGARLTIFYANRDKVRDDAAYWRILASLWMEMDTCYPNLKYWKELFMSDRRDRFKLMQKNDRRVWRKLPAKVTAFRAVHESENVDGAISWTLSRTVAEKFAEGRKVVERMFSKREIIAYFDRRHEQEIIVLQEGHGNG